MPAASSKYVPPNIQERAFCRLCSRKALKSVFELPATPLANAFETGKKRSTELFPLEVMMCSSCHHAQLKHVVHPHLLFSHYKYASGTSSVFVDHFGRYAVDEYARWGVTPADLVVEIGSNDGTLLERFKNLGCRVVGVEPAQNLAEIAEKKNIYTVNSFFTPMVSTSVKTGNGLAKLIVANNVLAHIDDFPTVIRSCQRLLDPKGVLIFEVHYAGALLSKGTFDSVYHEHVDYHALAPLVEFFVACTNLRVLRVEHVPTHGGSIRVTVGSAALRTVENDKTVNDLLHEEQVAATNSPAVWSLLHAKVAKARNAFKGQLGAIFREDPDASVVGFGAPAKATTLMYAFGLKTADLDYIVDDSPLKQGLFTPGLNIPVKKPDVLLANRPPYVVVLAWNFAESIIAKWKPILPDTTFLVPFKET